MPQWYRHPSASNFYSLHTAYDQYVRQCFLDLDLDLYRYVTFLDLQPSASLKELGIAQDRTGCIHLKLEVRGKRHVRLAEVLTAKAQIQGESRVQFAVHEDHWPYKFPIYYLIFSSPQDIAEFIRGIPDINTLCRAEIFSTDLVNELKKIAEFCIEFPISKYESEITERGEYFDLRRPISKIPREIYHHNLPVVTLKKDYDANTSGIFGLLRSHLSNETLSVQELKELKRRLSQGESPNQWDPCSGLMTLDCCDDLRVFELLVIYGADFLTPHGSALYYSTFDVLRHFNNVAKLQIISAAMCQVERPLRVKNVTVGRRANRVVTQLDLYRKDDPAQAITQSLQTELTTQISVTEKQEIVDFSCQFFMKRRDPNQIALSQSVLYDLNRPGVMLELIRDTGSQAMRGFVIYEWLQLTQQQQSTIRVLYWSLSCVDEKLQNSGIIPFLFWRAAIALGVDLIGFLAVTWKSSRLAKGLFWPKFQSAHLEQLVLRFIKALEIPESSYHHDVLSCYVKDQLMPIREDPLTPANLLARIFYREFLEEPTMTSRFKATPMMMFSSDESIHSIASHCQTLGFDLRSHLERLGPELVRLLQVNTALRFLPQPKLTKFPLKKAYYLFWRNESVETEEAIPNPWYSRPKL